MSVSKINLFFYSVNKGFNMLTEILCPLSFKSCLFNSLLQIKQIFCRDADGSDAVVSFFAASFASSASGR